MDLCEMEFGAHLAADLLAAPAPFLAGLGVLRARWGF